MINADNIQSITLQVATPETILAWSQGQVTHAIAGRNTEKYSLYSQTIFGPIHDYTCSCGKPPKGYFNKRCPKCGTLVTRRNLRRELMGHIELPVPIAHPLFLQTIAELLSLSKSQLQEVLLGNKFLNFSLAEATPKTKIITLEEYLKLTDNAHAGTGPEIIYKILKQFTPKLLKKLPQEKYGLLPTYFSETFKPEHLMLLQLPVLPADFRLNVIQATKIAVDPYNNIYTAILNTSNRIKELQNSKGEVNQAFINIEIANLQKLVTALFTEIPEGTPIVNMPNYRSLIDKLSHKSGIFRQSLLGKRVDYSGRSVIIVDPKLNFDQCGLPRRIALEIFRPFIIQKVEELTLANKKHQTRDSINTAITQLITTLDSPDFRDAPEYDVEQKQNLKLHPLLQALKEIINDYFVLLNRTPSLHRLSMQAFSPLLCNDHAIHLHPLVCAGYNADFDGDTMSVHLPLTTASQMEARRLMLSSKNILSPGSGKPLALPSQDMILGLYYLTYTSGDKIFKVFDSKGDAKEYYAQQSSQEGNHEHPPFTIHTRIMVKLDSKDFPLHLKVKKRTYVITTLGNLELYLNSRFPKKYRLFREENGQYYLDTPLNKDELKAFINKVYNPKDPKETANLLDILKEIGFEMASKYGLSLAATDFPVLANKQSLLEQTQAKINSLEEFDEEQRFQQEIKIWEDCNKAMLNTLDEQLQQNPDNAVTLIRSSKARGNDEQWSSIYTMRGYMKDTENQTVPYLIASNLIEGMSTFDYFVSCHGTRKGLTDTALNTGKSGYLTRKLVLAAQDEVITTKDCCGNGKYIPGRYVEEIKDQDIETLTARISGRFLAETIGPYAANSYIDHSKAKQIIALIKETAPEHPVKIKVRSVFTCRAKKGICQKCYGRDASTRKLVEVGTPVGIIAAQSLCEPTTQFTLRSFHNAGSSAASDITDSITDLSKLFESKTPLTSQEEQQIDSKDSLIEALLSKIMHIYSENGASIKSIHAEVLLKQILRENAEGKTVSIGIKTAIKEKGFLTAASFQNTETVLAKAALCQATDKLTNINSNVLLGKLIPIGPNTSNKKRS